MKQMKMKPSKVLLSAPLAFLMTLALIVAAAAFHQWSATAVSIVLFLVEYRYAELKLRHGIIHRALGVVGGTLMKVINEKVSA